MDTNICAVCLEAYNVNSVILRCNHQFCHCCIERWCQESYNCPTCRREITPDRFVSSDTGTDIQINAHTIIMPVYHDRSILNRCVCACPRRCLLLLIILIICCVIIICAFTFGYAMIIYL